MAVDETGNTPGSLDVQYEQSEGVGRPVEDLALQQARKADSNTTAEHVPGMSGPAQRIEPTPSKGSAAVSGRGWLIPIGGRMEDPAIITRFIELCGGASARIAIVPTASQYADAGEWYGNIFAAHGARNAEALKLTSRNDAENPRHFDIVGNATGIFFTGGNQLKLSTVVVNTPLAELLRSRYAHGVHVAGTSAGAAILSRHMIAFGEEGQMPRAAMVTTSAGLGFTERFIIDQHFRERHRLGRLLTAVAYNPGLIGIGVDENTAAFIAPDDDVHVVGQGSVTIVDPTNLDSTAILEALPGVPIDLPGMQTHVLSAGERYDL